MGKQASSQAQIPPTLPSKRPRPRTSQAISQTQSSPSYQRLKRSRTLDHAPPTSEKTTPSPAVGRMGKQASSQAQIRSSLPSKRPRTSQAISQAQISPSYQRSSTLDHPYSTAQIHFPHWGAKRARTAWRDWANLGDGPAGLMADLVLANDVGDYIRFRAVCRPWRRCCVTPHACDVLDRRFHMRQWIMIREKPADPQIRRFLNVSTGQCVQVDLPELRDHSILQSTTEGLLVLLGMSTNVLRLLNPLTRQVAELPQMTSLGFEFSGNLLNGAGLADERTFVLYFGGMRTLAFAKPGDEHWVLVKFDKLLMPTLSFGARFYGVTTDALMVVETRESLPPRLVVAAKLAKPFFRMEDTMHLVENCGQLMLVHRKIREIRDAEDCFKRSYKVYRVDLDANKVTPAHGLNGQAVFICCYRALSVHPQVFPYITADTVYPGFNLPERIGHEQIGGYHVKDGSIEPSNYDMWSGLAHPLSVADLLADYVSG